MQDESILHRITNLVDEENAIRQAEAAEGPTAERRQRLDEIKETLDQCWDLLRQRRALEENHEDPDRARVRDAGVVEHYQQ